MSDAAPIAITSQGNAPATTDALNAVLADTLALYMKTKGFHWHMKGSHFRDYHLMLDDQAAQILGTVDEIAERVRKTGGATLRSIGDIARRQRIRDNDAADLSASGMLQELHRDNLLLVQGLREVKALADGTGDNGSSGMIDGWTDMAEERAWFLSETSQAG